MTDDSGGASAPISVNPSATADQLKSAFRSLLVAAAAYASGKGWIPADIGGALVSVILIGGPILWAQVEVVIKKRTLVTVAEAAPDSVAVVKS